MNVIKFFLFFVLLLVQFIFVFSFNVCNVDFSEPWFAVKDSAGTDVLIVDGQGDLYLEGEDHSGSTFSLYGGLKFEDSFFFNHITSRYSSLFQERSSISGTGVVIEGDNDVFVAEFSSGGVINLLGRAAVEGEQAGCSADGNYCVGDSRETRDYYCDLMGSKTGSCTYDITSTLDCNENNGWTCLAGNVRAYADYTCSGSSCGVDSYSSQYDCDVSDGWTCSGSSRVYRDYACGGGSCSYSTTSSEVCEYGCSGGSCNACVPESSATTCSGTCGLQTNNCGGTVNCGSCGPVCGNGICEGGESCSSCSSDCGSCPVSNLGSASCEVYSCEGTFGCGGTYTLDSLGNLVYCPSTWDFSGVAQGSTIGLASCEEVDHPLGSGSNWGCDSWSFSGVATGGPVFCTEGNFVDAVYSSRSGLLIAFRCDDGSRVCSGYSKVNEVYSEHGLIGFDCN